MVIIVVLLLSFSVDFSPVSLKFAKIITIFSLLVQELELVSKELNHLVAILHVYAGGLIFMK